MCVCVCEHKGLNGRLQVAGKGQNVPGRRTLASAKAQVKETLHILW